MEPGGKRTLDGPRWWLKRSEPLIYGLFLPLGFVANLGLGVLILSLLHPVAWAGWLQVGTGAFCCLIAGWLAAAAFSKSYWSRMVTSQVAVCRQLADTFFAWVEDASLPDEDLKRLKTSLDQIVPTADRR